MITVFQTREMLGGLVRKVFQVVNCYFSPQNKVSGDDYI